MTNLMGSVGSTTITSFLPSSGSVGTLVTITGTISVTTALGTGTSSSSFTVTAFAYPSVQQGSKLVGTGAVNGGNGAHQGESVSLSADGTTAFVGGDGDNSYAGAAWVIVTAHNTTGDSPASEPFGGRKIQ